MKVGYIIFAVVVLGVGAYIYFTAKKKVVVPGNAVVTEPVVTVPTKTPPGVKPD